MSLAQHQMPRPVPWVRLDADAEGERRTSVFEPFLTVSKLIQERTKRLKRCEERCSAGAVQSPLCLWEQERCDIKVHRRQRGRLVDCSGPEGSLQKHEL